MPARFTPEDLAAIQDAVAAAERQTSGEFVVAVTPQSDTYPEVLWKAATLGTVLGLAAVLAYDLLYSGWGVTWLHRAWGASVVVAGCAALLVALSFASRGFRRMLIGPARLEAAAHHRALQTFSSEKVYATRRHTGVLLFLSLFEHRIEVLADEGISKVVPPEKWGDIVALIRRGVLEDRVPMSVAEAIALSGTLLAEADLPPEADDTNELPNTLRILP
ncbi:MAG: hypothetical protein LCH53_06470 [Bacteroidetes bacterium]|nr:hypothetical protein [Bacteroidota bacterium]